MIEIYAQVGVKFIRFICNNTAEATRYAVETSTGSWMLIYFPHVIYDWETVIIIS